MQNIPVIRGPYDEFCSLVTLRVLHLPGFWSMRLGCKASNVVGLGVGAGRGSADALHLQISNMQKEAIGFAMAQIPILVRVNGVAAIRDFREQYSTG